MVFEVVAIGGVDDGGWNDMRGLGLCMGVDGVIVQISQSL